MYASERSVEVKGATEGSGYLIAPNLILTSWHVVGAVKTAQIRVLGQYQAGASPVDFERFPAEILWPDHDPGEENDFALLRASRPVPCGGPVGWMALQKTGELEVQATGFPNFRVFTNSFLGRFGLGSRRERDTHQIRGTVSAGSILKQRQFGAGNFEVALRPECVPAASKEMWEGMSGAALFSGDRLLGVVKGVSEVRDYHRLHAQPVERLFTRNDVQSAVRSAGLELPAQLAQGSTAHAFNPSAHLHFLDRHEVSIQILDQFDSWQPEQRLPLFLVLRAREDDDVRKLIQRLREDEFRLTKYSLTIKEISWPAGVRPGEAEKRLEGEVKRAFGYTSDERKAVLTAESVYRHLPGDNNVMLIYSIISTDDLRGTDQQAILAWWQAFWRKIAACGGKIAVFIVLEQCAKAGACCTNPALHECAALAAAGGDCPANLDMSWFCLDDLEPIRKHDIARWLESLEQRQRDWKESIEQVGIRLDVAFDQPQVLPRRLRCVKLGLPVLLGEQRGQG